MIKRSIRTLLVASFASLHLFVEDMVHCNQAFALRAEQSSAARVPHGGRVPCLVAEQMHPSSVVGVPVAPKSGVFEYALQAAVGDLYSPYQRIPVSLELNLHHIGDTRDDAC